MSDVKHENHRPDYLAPLPGEARRDKKQEGTLAQRLASPENLAKGWIERCLRCTSALLDAESSLLRDGFKLARAPTNKTLKLIEERYLTLADIWVGEPQSFRFYSRLGNMEHAGRLEKELARLEYGPPNPVGKKRIARDVVGWLKPLIDEGWRP